MCVEFRAMRGFYHKAVISSVVFSFLFFCPVFPQHAMTQPKPLTQALSFPAQEIIQQDDKMRKYSYQINFAQALASVKNTIVLLFNRSSNLISEIIRELTELFSVTIEPIRPGRKFIRKPKPRKKYYLNYKPIG